MIVAESGETRLDALQHAVAAFERGGIRLVGVVLNRQIARDGAGYYYGSTYEVKQESDKPAPLVPLAPLTGNGATSWLTADRSPSWAITIAPRATGQTLGGRTAPAQALGESRPSAEATDGHA